MASMVAAAETAAIGTTSGFIIPGIFAACSSIKNTWRCTQESLYRWPIGLPIFHFLKSFLSTLFSIQEHSFRDPVNQFDAQVPANMLKKSFSSPPLMKTSLFHSFLCRLSVHPADPPAKKWHRKMPAISFFPNFVLLSFLRPPFPKTRQAGQSTDFVPFPAW